MAQTNINIRIDSKTKKDAEKVFCDLGISMTTAITIFLKQCIREEGIPFKVTNVPNKETLNVIKQAAAGKNLVGPFNTIEDTFKALDD